MRCARVWGALGVLLSGGLLTGWAGGCSPKDPTPSESVEVPYRLTTYYALEQTEDDDYTARARFYDALQFFDWAGNAGTLALTGGDAAYADGIHLAKETRTSHGTGQRVDYSAFIPAGKGEYLFEFRRGNGDVIEAKIPAPENFDITQVTDNGYRAEIKWEPAVKDAKVTLTIDTEDTGCLLVAGDLARNIDDRGTYDWLSLQQHSRLNDCNYVITIERRVRTNRPANWIRQGQKIPANGVYVEHIRTRRVKLLMKQRG